MNCAAVALVVAMVVAALALVVTVVVAAEGKAPCLTSVCGHLLTQKQSQGTPFSEQRVVVRTGSGNRW